MKLINLVHDELLEKNPTISVELSYRNLVDMLVLREQIGMEKELTEEQRQEAVTQNTKIQLMEMALKMIRKIADKTPEVSNGEIPDLELKMADARKKIYEANLKIEEQNVLTGLLLRNALISINTQHGK